MRLEWGSLTCPCESGSLPLYEVAPFLDCITKVFHMCNIISQKT